MTIKVLFYADPHPIRNSLVEFYTPAKMMCEIANQSSFSEIPWRIFSNSHILKLIADICPSEKIISPTDAEEAELLSFLKEWDNENILSRTDLVMGGGHYFSFYYEVLARIKEFFDFTHIILWSENGIVKQFAQDHGIGVIHMELGPTRSPFLETIYFDPFGTNGNSFLSSLSQNDLAIVNEYAMDTWLNNNQIDFQSSLLNSLLASPLPEKYAALYAQPYVIVALQLFDDLNTIQHSRFNAPKDFLEFILPDLIDHGYQVLIKGHPGAPFRPINLVHEVEALSFAETFGDKVTILNRSLKPSDFVPILANAHAVLSINSSVSFEAWLLGTPGLVFGHATYDINENLLKSSEEFLRSNIIEYSSKEINYSFLMQHYFIPNNSLFLSEILALLVKTFDFSGSQRDYLDWLTTNVNSLDIELNKEIFKSKWDMKKSNLLKSPQINSEKYRFNIEHYESMGGIISLKGWVGRLDVNSEHPIEASLIYDGNVLEITPLVNREDVKTVYSEISRFSGFDFNITSPDIFDESLLRLVVIDKNSANLIPLIGSYQVDVQAFASKLSIKHIIRRTLSLVFHNARKIIVVIRR